MANIDRKISSALQLHQAGNVLGARDIYEQVLKKVPAHVNALNLLGVTFIQTGEYQKGHHYVKKALALRPDFLEAYNNLGIALRGLHQYEEAIVCYQKILLLRPNFVEAYCNLGLAQEKMNRRDEAIICYQKALSIRPDHADALYNLGNILKELKRYQEAIACYRKLLSIKPNFAEAYNSLGISLKSMDEFDEAIVCYEFALSIKPNLVEAHFNLGNAHGELRRHREAVAHYRSAIAINPNYADAYNNLGNSMRELKRYEEAFESYNMALSIEPNSADVYNNLGNALQELDQHEEAVAAYRKALDIDLDHADAYFNLGNTLSRLKRYEEAGENFQNALACKPDYSFALGRFLHGEMNCCNWERIDDIFQELFASIDAGRSVADPLILLSTPSTMAQQKRCAELFTRKKFPEAQQMPCFGGRVSSDKIRLAYISADFRTHPVGYLMAGVFEQHDKARFETIAISLGVDDQSQLRERLLQAFDKFVDARMMETAQITQLILDLEIDIAVDLGGHTAGARTEIFAQRVAPVQVNYLGYTGTMGADYMDYILADRHVIPESDRVFFNEKIAYLPNTFQANDSHKVVSERKFTRAEVGLPDDGFVFCCFNNSYKITPVIFKVWMQLLKQVEKSTLWLLEGDAQIRQNIRKEAEKHGIAPDRIVFAERLDLPDHLARHRLADLFLDTFIYNAASTASDALWAGLPVLTCMGKTFAGRVAASLLHAVGVPELITHSHEDYMGLAIELATNPEKLAAIKLQLARNLNSYPLFDTVLFTRHIEDAFFQMQERYRKSLLPDHLFVGA